MNKIYQASANIEFHTNIMHKGKIVRISFIGGSLSPRRSNGKFGTLDTDLQQSLEKDSGFNKTFKLLEAKYDLSSVKEKSADDSFLVVEEVDSVQAAKEWLLKEFPDEFTPNELRSRVAVSAIILNKKILFPNM